MVDASLLLTLISLLLPHLYRDKHNSSIGSVEDDLAQQGNMFQAQLLEPVLSQKDVLDFPTAGFLKFGCKVD